MVIFKIRSLLDWMACPAHLGHPYSQFNAGPTRENVVCDVAVATGGRIFLPLHQCLGMGALEIALVFLRMTFLTFLVVEKKRGYSFKELRIRMFHTLFFNI